MTDQQYHTDMLRPIEASQEEFDDLLEELRTEVSRADAEAALVDSARHNEGDVVRAILTVYPPLSPASNGNTVVNCTDDHRNTPLHMAAANGHVDIVTLLLRCGADPSMRNEKGNTPLHWAATNGQQAVVEILLKQQHVDVLQRNEFGKSALSAGFESQNTSVVQSLLEHETASEERLLQTDNNDTDAAMTDAANDTTSNSKNKGVTHDFMFGGSTRVRIRELPMARTDDDTILGQTQPSDDTTGLGIWAASLVTAQWLVALSQSASHRDVWQRCHSLLELGAGCGIPGLTMAQAVPTISKVYVTDFNPRTVANLRHNIALNHPDDTFSRVQALEMNWQDSSTWPASENGLDILVGSDLIYQFDMVPVLLQTVTALLAPNGTFFYVAPATGRQGQESFFAGLAAAGWQLQEHVLDPAYKSNPLASGDDDECFVHFHELQSAEWKLYEFSKQK